MKLTYDGVGIELHGAGRMTPDPNWRIGAHNHEQYEIHFITEGIGVNQLDNGEIDLYPGVVYWAPDLLSIFETMNVGAGEAGMGNRLLGRMHMIEMIWKVLDSRLQKSAKSSASLPLGQPGKTSPLLEKAVLYVQQNFYRNPTVAEIADACFVSERDLSRLFLREMRLTVNQFVQSERLFYASTELKHTNTPLQDICEKLRFSSMQYFAQWFKGLSSMTPTEFRKKHQIK